MKEHQTTAMVALAVVFAIALVLTVTLICLSSSNKETPPISQEKPTQPNRPYPLDSTTPQLDSSAITVFLPETIAPESTVTEDLLSGLRFRENGNGTCTLIGVGSCRDAFVVIPEYAPSGSRVVSIADGALMGSSEITAIQIPKTVIDIGYLALANCPNLIYISVNDQNPYYCDADGVLYSANMQTLIQYPPLRAGDSYFISSSVTRISDMAFYNCANLTTVRYEGTPEMWDTILIGTKNYSLTAAAVRFSAEKDTP